MNQSTNKQTKQHTNTQVLGLKGGVKLTKKVEHQNERKIKLKELVAKSKSTALNYVAIMEEVERMGSLISSNNSQQAGCLFIDSLFVH